MNDEKLVRSGWSFFGVIAVVAFVTATLIGACHVGKAVSRHLDERVVEPIGRKAQARFFETRRREAQIMAEAWREVEKAWEKVERATRDASERETDE